MPVMDGIELLTRIRQRDARTFVILVTAYATINTAVEAMKCGAFGYSVKPIDLDQLGAQLESAFAARDLLLENISLREQDRPGISILLRRQAKCRLPIVLDDSGYDSRR